MFAQEKADNLELGANGTFMITKNSVDPPPPIRGLLYKEGHIVKNWKLRLIVVENGKLSYYKLSGPSDAGKALKGSFNLRGYSIQKTNHEMYLWPSRIGQDGKDLRLHTPDGQDMNKYPMKVWVAAIRSHIRYAHETYYPKLNWFPFYQHVTQDPSSQYDRPKLFQVVRRDGVNVEVDFEDHTTFTSFKRYHEIIEITDLLVNTTNTLRGKLSNGEGWVSICTLDGCIVLLELTPSELGRTVTELGRMVSTGGGGDFDEADEGDPKKR